MADKRISQLIERTDIANNDVLPIVASGATTTNKVTISTIQDWMQDNLDVGVTSVGLSMPSAFVVSNSPVTASGNITVTGAGTVSQYIRGDGSLADFPQSGGGGGASVNYYLNGSVSQGTIGGIAYYEMNRTPILGAGTNFTINANGYIASFITDAGNPGLLEIPGGNWNLETYFAASSGGGSPSFYVELYKVNSGGTATLVASNSANPELIAFGTTTTAYFSSLAVPTTVLTLTDRLALRYYVTHAGRTITMHTENSNLCQIITTFTTGLTALNGLTAQVQNFATGTSGTDFNISSAGSTHTFNIPSASATARGLVTTGTQTIAGSKTFSDTLFTTPDAIINGLNVGKGGGNLTTNTSFGTAALGANTTGTGNTAIGFGSSQSNTTGSSNTAVGLYSLLYNTIGASNTAIGSGSMLTNTIGNQNTAIGDSSLYSNTSGSQNTAVGRGSLNTNSTGSDNSGIGFFALYSNTTGSANTSVGSRSLYTNTTGTGNTATGYFSLRFNTTGGSNTATGYLALSANTTGNANTATGAYALENNTTGTDNTAVGQNALEDNTTGGFNVATGVGVLKSNTTGTSNTASGAYALYSSTTASDNTAFGVNSMYRNTTGNHNTSSGITSLFGNTTGTQNVAIGSNAGSYIAGGITENSITNNSIYIGVSTRALGNNQTNQIVIGHLTTGNGSNTVTIGNSSITENYFTGNIRGGALISTSDSTINGVSIGRGASSVATNTSLGFQTLAFNTTGSSNTSVGWNSLYLNTSGSNNTSIGVSSGASNTTGGSNSFYGVSSGFANTTGSNNSFFGNVSGQENTTGAQNSFFGASSGRYIANGSPLTIANNSVMLGFDTRALGNNQTNQIVIGHNAIGNGSNTVTIGNDSITSNIFSGNLSTRRAVGTASEGIIELRPNTGSSNIIIASGAVPLHILSTSGSLGLGVGSTPQVTIASGGAVTLTGALNGTSASFTGAATTPITCINDGQRQVGLFRSSLDGGFMTFQSSGANTRGFIGNGAGISSLGETSFGVRSESDLILMSGGNNVRLTLASTGAATFSSSVTAQGGKSQFVANGGDSAGAGISLNTGLSGTDRRNWFIGTEENVAGDFTIKCSTAAGGVGGSGNTRLAILNNGNVGIGTPTPGYRFTVGVDAETSTLQTYTNGTSGANQGAVIRSWTYSTENYRRYTDIVSIGNWDGTNGTSAMRFFTQGNSTTPTERMQITSGGNVLIGKITSGQILSNGFEYNVANNWISSCSSVAGDTSGYFANTATSGTRFLLRFYGTSSEVGRIQHDGANTSYVTSSDYRLKEDFKEVSGLDKVSAIKTYDFKWKNSDNRMDGVIAHELAEVLPYAVSGDKDEVEEDGSIKVQGVDYSKIVPILIKAIQEQQEQIKSLTEQVEALKSQING